MNFRELAGLFEGDEVTIVSAGKSTVDYEASVRTRRVILINHAIALAPRFPRHCLYHVTLHPEVFCTYRQLESHNVTPVCGNWGHLMLSPAAGAKVATFGTRQFPSLADPELGRTARDARECLTQGIVCHVANSSHCAVHFAWLLGCRRLQVIGATEYQGVPVAGYDERLEVPANYAVQTTSAAEYIDSFRRFVELLEWEEIRYLGE